MIDQLIKKLPAVKKPECYYCLHKIPMYLTLSQEKYGYVLKLTSAFGDYTNAPKKKDKKEIETKRVKEKNTKRYREWNIDRTKIQGMDK
jgi:hypothetical protein